MERECSLLNNIVNGMRGIRVVRCAGLVPTIRLWPRVIRCSRKLRAAALPYLLADVRPGAVAVIDGHGPLSYADLARLVGAFGNTALVPLTRLGSPGPRVAVLVRNSRYAIVALLAGLATGSHVVLMNADMSPRQLAEVVTREGIDVIVHDQEFDPLAAKIDSRTARIVAWYDGPRPDNSIDAVVARAASDLLPCTETAGRLTLLTSGTTGTPKGAPRGQQRMPLAMFAGFLDEFPIRPSDRIVLGAPLFHGWGQLISLFALMLGATQILDRRFDAQRTVQAIREHDATALVVVPTIMGRILNLPAAELDRIALTRLRLIGTGGRRCPNRSSGRCSTGSAWSCTTSTGAPRRLSSRSRPRRTCAPPRGARAAHLRADVPVYVVQPREDLQICRDTWQALT
jgi:acyl-CoA synthetase (AMP-forming)/AMP-acid ligase II